MTPECCEEAVDAAEQAIVDDPLILERLYLMPSFVSLLMDLILLGAYKRPLVDVGMWFEVRVVREFQSVPLAVIENHGEGSEGAISISQTL